jgi:hypothetical protein
MEEFDDGISGYTNRMVSDHTDSEDAGPDNVIRGMRLKFLDEKWIDKNGIEMPPTMELIFVDVCRVVQKWKAKKRVETIVLGPGQEWPDIDALNDEVKDEWEVKFGKMTGPWQAARMVYLRDPASLDRFTYPGHNTGDGLAVDELVERARWMRRLRGEHVHPVITLSNTFMSTGYGGRKRPHFAVKRWVMLGNDNKVIAEQKTPEIAKPKIGTPIDAPSLGEEMDDGIKF